MDLDNVIFTEVEGLDFQQNHHTIAIFLYDQVK